jgi:hypothetical protein
LSSKLIEKQHTYVVNKYSELKGVQTIKDIDFREVQQSNILFILGTGSSILEYTESDWKTINDHDSVGVNYWAIHDFTPDFYTFELPKNKDHRDAMYHMFSARAEEYSDVPMLLKNVPNGSNEIDMNRLPKDMKDNLFLSVEIPVPWDGVNSDTLYEGYNILNGMKYFSQTNIQTIPFRIATILYLISLGVNMNYDSIVLCGVDLSNPDHFYTKNSTHYLDRSIPIKKQSVDREVHKTIDKDQQSLTVVDGIKALNETILTKKGIELYIGSTKSALHPYLDYFFD